MPSPSVFLQLLRSVDALGDRQFAVLARIALFACDNGGIQDSDLEAFALRTKQSYAEVLEAFEIFTHYADVVDGRYQLKGQPKKPKADRNIPETLSPEQLLFERFRTRYNTLFEMPYIPQAKDFVGITKLRKHCESSGWELNEERWDRAVANYLISDLGVFTVSHLCSPPVFSSLYRNPLDKFGKPKPMMNGANSGAPRMVI